MALATAAPLASIGAQELRPLEGSFVRVSGYPGRYEPDPWVREEFPDAEPVEVNGELGRVLHWDDSLGKYCVQTFGAAVLHLSEEYLTEYEPADPEEKEGFDVAWPSGPSAHGIFSGMVAEHIKTKGFCVIQTMLSEYAASEAVSLAQELTYGTLRDDVEEEYLGSDNVTKVSWIQYEGANDDGEEPVGMKAFDIEDMGPDMSFDSLDGIGYCDKVMTCFAASMWPLTPDFEDDKSFLAWGRTNPLVRASMEAGEVHSMRANPIPVDPSLEQESHLQFVSSKKLCLMFLIENDGGELILTPQPEAYDFSEVTLPLSKNKLVVFRCDAQGLTHTYKPEGKSLALQTWVLDEPEAVKNQEAQLRIIDGPPEPLGQRNNVMSIMTRYPGCGYEPLAYWTMLQSGGDTQVLVPVMRWDVDIYYRKEHTIGFSMTCHGALIQQAEIEQFDNQFFGILPEEAWTMAPYQRCLLEVGYETLARAGHTKDELRNFKCGVFVGDSGSDWDGLVHQTPENHKWILQGRERSAAAGRLSHIMGMTGPISTAETACSSSLVAVGVCQMTMRMRLADQQTCNMATELYHGLSLGVNTLIGAGSYISLSGPGMLTSQGRCFTFDQSADGFARGEGIGGIKFKICDTSLDRIDRIAVLIGACVNQDGRSASMTAPHGPSQQEVIRASMREGGLSTENITIAECHGTGTALGDPIEVGALRGIFKANREIPFMKTSAKTNIGHLEAAAGVAGLIKCIQMTYWSTGSPNLHLLTLNPHLDVAGYPVYFQTEATDFSANSSLTGVSSFGFGGTNARADVWGHCQVGSRFAITGTLLKSRQMFLS